MLLNNYNTLNKQTTVVITRQNKHLSCKHTCNDFNGYFPACLRKPLEIAKEAFLKGRCPSSQWYNCVKAPKATVCRKWSQ